MDETAVDMSSSQLLDTSNDFNNTNNSFASTFRGRNTAMSTEELRKARESRAADALRMKDEQLRILSEQNANLLKTLDRVSTIILYHLLVLMRNLVFQ